MILRNGYIFFHLRNVLKYFTNSVKSVMNNATGQTGRHFVQHRGAICYCDSFGTFSGLGHFFFFIMDTIIEFSLDKNINVY